LAAVALAAPPCPGCAGGGEVNGLTCRECDGSRRLTSRRRRRWRFPSPLKVADTLATPVGTLVRWSASLPGLAGAGGVSYGCAAVVHSVFGQVPLVAVAVLTAGVFALALDRRL
jgi:hypothetical protein